VTANTEEKYGKGQAKYGLVSKKKSLKMKGDSMKGGVKKKSLGGKASQGPWHLVRTILRGEEKNTENTGKERCAAPRWGHRVPAEDAGEG